MLVIARKIPHLGLFAFLILVASANTFAQGIDPHRLYEDRCAGCHDFHAGDFVHNSLVLSDGKIIGRKNSKELLAFLNAGHGKLSGQEIDAMVAHLENIQKSGRLFHDKCVICHDRAVVLARTKLIIKNGRLIGRYSDRDMEEFLTDHGRLEPDEVAKMLKVLNRQLKTR